MLEVNEAQPLARYSDTGRRENFRDREVTWVTTIYGITKDINLLTLGQRDWMVDYNRIQSLNYNYSRNGAFDRGGPTSVENARFVGKWIDDAATSEGGLVSMAVQVYDAPLSHLKIQRLRCHRATVWPFAKSRWVDMVGRPNKASVEYIQFGSVHRLYSSRQYLYDIVKIQIDMNPTGTHQGFVHFPQACTHSSAVGLFVYLQSR